MSDRWCRSSQCQADIGKSGHECTNRTAVHGSRTIAHRCIRCRWRLLSRTVRSRSSSRKSCFAGARYSTGLPSALRPPGSNSLVPRSNKHVSAMSPGELAQRPDVADHVAGDAEQAGEPQRSKERFHVSASRRPISKDPLCGRPPPPRGFVSDRQRLPAIVSPQTPAWPVSIRPGGG